ncbi:MAG: hypothetical protein A4E66_02753 [Syntrophus sp. PtaB.Bin001]|nr:MAG: hypothetical protein A4E66_02753 [Syntrophus sp. PtaB.Bin001]
MRLQNAASLSRFIVGRSLLPTHQSQRTYAHTAEKSPAAYLGPIIVFRYRVDFRFFVIFLRDVFQTVVLFTLTHFQTSG